MCHPRRSVRVRQSLALQLLRPRTMSFLHSERAVGYWQARRHEHLSKKRWRILCKVPGQEGRHMRLLAAGLVAVGVVVAAASSPIEAGAAPTRSIGWREVTVPAGTSLSVVLDTPVGSDISRVEQPVHAHLARSVLVNGATAIPGGSAVSGYVTSARRSGKVKGRAYVSMRFSSLSPAGNTESYRI